MGFANRYRKAAHHYYCQTNQFSLHNFADHSNSTTITGLTPLNCEKLRSMDARRKTAVEDPSYLQKS